MSFNYPFYKSQIGTATAMSPITDGGVKKVFHGFPSTEYLVSNNSYSGSAQSVSKDMSYSSSRSINAGFNPYTGNALTPSGNRYSWSDWSSDVFDAWGDFNIFNPATNTSEYIQFSTINGPDGTIYSETQTMHSKTFEIKHGYVAQGVFKLDIACTDSAFTFWISHWGNMGSDGSTQNTNNTYTSASWGNLFWNFNQQAGSSSEVFSTYCIPKLTTINNQGNWGNAIFFSGISGNDNLALWYGPLTHGATIYYAKSSNISSNVANDIVKTTGSWY
tara:strand:- start:1821 stop:2645 length:825 start_codon:yes stop_codon:yes gene_type:complete